MKNVSIAASLPDKFQKKEQNPFLNKDQWETAYTVMARQYGEADQIVGKPKVCKYFPAMKPSDLNREFDGTFKYYKVI